jgi:hypothetical protein
MARALTGIDVPPREGPDPAHLTPSSPSSDAEQRWGGTSRRRNVIIASCALVVPVLYFVFVARYGVNLIYWDQWSNVAMLNAALHGHLTWKMLWSQHTQNRMLFPYLVFIGFARFGHFDTKSIMYLSAVLLSLGYALLLALYRIYARQWLGPLFTLLIGAVWFSLADWENALWGFQFAWYLIVFCAMAMMLCLSSKRGGALAVIGAIGLAVVASYSSLQGLILWPMGLLILVWRIRDRSRVFRVTAVWVACGLVTTAIYFRGLGLQPSGVGGGSVVFAVHHPVGVVEYFLTAVGNVVPVDVGLRPHQLLGLVLSLVAVYVFYRSCREKPADRGTPLPAALILFAFLFDISIAFGRVSLGVGEALSSRYTMANLLLLVGMALYLVRLSPAQAHAHSVDRRVRPAQLGVVVVLALFLLLQIGLSSKVGIESARTTKAERIEGARAIVNLSEMSVQQQSRYLRADVFPSLRVLEPLLSVAQQDQLSVFAPGLRDYYEELGPPPT